MKNLATHLTKLLLFATILVTPLTSQAVSQREETRKIDHFESVYLSISAKVIIQQDEKTTLKIVGSDKALNDIVTKVDGSTLKIRYKNRWGQHTTFRDKPTIYITSPQVKDMNISGSGKIEARGPIKTGEVRYNISGSGNIIIPQLSAKDITCKISGSGNINIKGEETDYLKINISGSGDINCTELKTKDVDIHISGSGNAKVHAIKNLKAMITGSGDIYYQGNPSLDTRTAGSGRIKSINH